MNTGSHTIRLTIVFHPFGLHKQFCLILYLHPRGLQDVQSGMDSQCEIDLLIPLDFSQKTPSVHFSNCLSIEEACIKKRYPQKNTQIYYSQRWSYQLWSKVFSCYDIINTNASLSIIGHPLAGYDPPCSDLRIILIIISIARN